MWRSLSLTPHPIHLCLPPPYTPQALQPSPRFKSLTPHPIPLQLSPLAVRLSLATDPSLYPLTNRFSPYFRHLSLLTLNPCRLLLVSSPSPFTQFPSNQFRYFNPQPLLSLPRLWPLSPRPLGLVLHPSFLVLHSSLNHFLILVLPIPSA